MKLGIFYNKLVFNIVIILYLNHKILVYGQCLAPNFQHIKTYSPNKTTYAEDDQIFLHCENKNIDLVQIQTCANGKWIGKEPICGKPTTNSLISRINTNIEVHDWKRHDDIEVDYTMVDVEKIRNRINIFFTNKKMIEPRKSTIYEITISFKKFNIKLIRLAAYYGYIGDPYPFWLDVDNKNHCRYINKTIDANSQWPSYNKKYPKCKNNFHDWYDCQFNPSANNSFTAKNITWTVNSEFFEALCGFDMYLVEPYDDHFR